MKILLSALALLLAGAVAAAPAHASDGLPDGVVARVYGQEISAKDVEARLVDRFQTGKRGQDVLDQMIEDRCIALEAAKRGVTVSEDEAREYMQKVNDKVVRDSGGTKSLATVFQDSGSNQVEFLAAVREFLLRQKMAREDMGGSGGHGESQYGIEGDLPMHRVKLWVKSVRARYEIKRTDLPGGVLAQVEGVPVSRTQFAETLASRLPEEVVKGLRDDLVFEAAVRHHAGLLRVELTEEDLDAEIGRLRKRFSEDPRVKGTGLTFDQFLEQTIGTGEKGLREEPGFRAKLALRTMLLPRATPDRIRRHYELNREAYGEQAMIRQFLIQARSAKSELGIDETLPTFSEAYEWALRVKVAILKEAGIGTQAAGAGPRKSLPDAVTAVAREFAKRFEKNPKRRESAGAPEVWTRARIAGERKLDEKVFEGELGLLVGPIRSSVGFHVLVVEERRPAPRFEDIQARLREDVLRVEIAEWRRDVQLSDEVITLDKLAPAEK